MDEMNKKLSILICSLQERADKLRKLLNRLEPQKTEEVEILIELDNRERSTGEKRNALIEKAAGEYIAFVDDDDLVSTDYIQKILAASETSPDCIGMEGLITFQSKNITRKFIHSMKYSSWFTKDDVYYRCPNHLNPVKRDIAKKVGFLNISVGEDHDYSNRLFPLLKTEVYIQEPIYYYLTR
jgi:glycosyltransferase involved in cell wall biosynthesis